MQSEYTFFLRFASVDEESGLDANQLAADLQRKLDLDSALAGSYSPLPEKTEQTNLGVGWKGALKFAKATKEQVKALVQALLAAFKDKRVRIRVEHGEQSTEFEMSFTKVEDVIAILETVGIRFDGEPVHG